MRVVYARTRRSHGAGCVRAHTEITWCGLCTRAHGDHTVRVVYARTWRSHGAGCVRAHTGVQGVIYVRGHNNCIPMRYRTNIDLWSQ